MQTDEEDDTEEKDDVIDALSTIVAEKKGYPQMDESNDAEAFPE